MAVPKLCGNGKKYGQKDSPDDSGDSLKLIGAFCVLKDSLFGQFPAHFLVCAVHGAEGGVG